MAERAVREALADAGVTWDAIGFAAGGSDVSGKPDTLVGRLGLTGVPFVNVQNGCATGASTVLTVADALRAGEASLGLAVGFDKHERGAFHVSAARYGLGDWYAETGGRSPPRCASSCRRSPRRMSPARTSARRSPLCWPGWASTAPPPPCSSCRRPA
ncbi:hypothetical protein [Streptomyces shaanxiensis]